jgi:23S rRNA pseudouridine1911/1915/1917 synthase
VKEQKFRFTTSSQGGRLDVTLVTQVPDFSRNRLQQLIRTGYVKVNDEVVTKPGFRLDGGESVEVIIPAPTPSTLRAESIPLDVVFENEDIILINKPAGMVVHPSAGHTSGTLVHAALAHAPDIMGVGGEKRPGVVHRLDKDTSGLILLAKNDTAHNNLQVQFKNREVGKVYLALVEGQPPTSSGRIEAPIGRDPGHRKKMKVLPPGRGREAISIFYTLESFSQHTLLEVKPKTGRTHQIRVHLAFLGCPVVGDRDYGQRKPTLPVDRMFLHAAALTFTLPGDEQARSFESPLPSELEMVLDQLRKP